MEELDQTVDEGEMSEVGNESDSIAPYQITLTGNISINVSKG